MTKVRGLLICPSDQTIREVEYDGDYKEIKKLLDIDSPIDARSIEGAGEESGTEETLWFDDEFLLKMEEGKPYDFFMLNGVAAPVGGNGLILGTNQEGESISTSLTVESTALNVSFKRMILKGWTASYTDEYDHPSYGKCTRIVGPQPIYEEVKP